MQQENSTGIDIKTTEVSMLANKKESKSIIMSMIACVVLTVASIGFGVYGMTRKQEGNDFENNLSFATFSKNLSNTKRDFLNFEPNRSLYYTDNEDYYLFGDFSIDENNTLGIYFGKTKQEPTLTQANVATDVLLAFYIEHGTYDSGNHTFGDSTVSQYIYYIDLAGDVYRFKLTEDEPLFIEHLKEYNDIVFISNTPGDAILVDIYGHTFKISNL